MKNLVNLKQNSHIKINNTTYEVLSKTSYMTMSSQDVYYKYILTDHNILVVIPTDEVVYMGKIVEDFEQGLNFSQTITYEGNVYEQVASDYQVVKSVEYGNPQEVEGEVVWADYQNEDIEQTYISCAWVYKTNKRADIVGTMLTPEQIQLVD